MPMAAELNIQRRATKQFIDANPTVISLWSVETIMSGGVAKRAPGGSRGPQTLRMIWLDETGIDRRPPSGSRSFDFVLVGEHDANMAIGDYWFNGEQEFRIEAVTPYNGWEVKAYGVSNGPKPTGT